MNFQSLCLLLYIPGPSLPNLSVWPTQKKSQSPACSQQPPGIQDQKNHWGSLCTLITKPLVYDMCFLLSTGDSSQKPGVPLYHICISKEGMRLGLLHLEAAQELPLLGQEKRNRYRWWAPLGEKACPIFHPFSGSFNDIYNHPKSQYQACWLKFQLFSAIEDKGSKFSEGF